MKHSFHSLGSVLTGIGRKSMSIAVRSDRLRNRRKKR